MVAQINFNMKIVAVFCFCLGLLRIEGSYGNGRFPYKSESKCSTQPTDRRPCKDQVTNKTIFTAMGEINCVVPSKEELLSKLKDIGGANPSYVATTEEEANNFPNLLPNVSESKIVYIRRRRGLGNELNLAKRNTILESNVTVIRCVLNDEVDTNTNGRVLCTRCQQTRTLDEKLYFPTKLNELRCGEGTIRGVDSKVCGRKTKCIQNNLFMPLLKYQGDSCTTSGGTEICTKKWEKFDFELPSCCECQKRK